MHSRHRNILVWAIAAVIAVCVLDALFPYAIAGAIAWLVVGLANRR